MEISKNGKFHLVKLLEATMSLFLLATTSTATPVTWTLNSVTLSDGGTASGSFTFNPDAGTACSSGGSSPCGAYTNVQITTTTGTSRMGTVYSFVCQQDVAGCAGVSPDSTEVMFLGSSSPNQTGNSALALFFTGIGALPPRGLTDAGGALDISNTKGSVGSADEGTCKDAACSGPANQARFSIAGSVAAVPEPASWLMALVGIGIVGVGISRRN